MLSELCPYACKANRPQIGQPSQRDLPQDTGRGFGDFFAAHQEVLGVPHRKVPNQLDISAVSVQCSSANVEDKTQLECYLHCACG